METGGAVSVSKALILLAECCCREPRGLVPWEGRVPGPTFDRRQPAKRCVRMALAIVPPPGLDLGAGVGQLQEPVGVECNCMVTRRRRRLNDSTNALSVGLPGPLK